MSSLIWNAVLFIVVSLVVYSMGFGLQPDGKIVVCVIVLVVQMLVYLEHALSNTLHDNQLEIKSLSDRIQKLESRPDVDMKKWERLNP